MREGLVIDHSRADAGEAAKDMASPGTGLAMHRRVDKALDDPEFALKRAMAQGMADAVRMRLEKRAAIPSWLTGYVHQLKGGRVGAALTQAAMAQVSSEDQLRDAIRLTGKYLSRTHGDFDRALYQRTLAMLARHGYDADIARQALLEIAQGRPDEDAPTDEA